MIAMNFYTIQYTIALLDGIGIFIQNNAAYENSPVVCSHDAHEHTTYIRDFGAFHFSLSVVYRTSTEKTWHTLLVKCTVGHLRGENTWSVLNEGKILINISRVLAGC